MKKTHLVFIAMFIFSNFAYSGIISVDEAKEYVGETVIVQGVVSNLFISKKGNCFLNMGGNYPNQKFSAVIFSNYTHLFTNLNDFEGKTISVKGEIKSYKGKPEIVISSKNQITLVNDDR